MRKRSSLLKFSGPCFTIVIIVKVMSDLQENRKSRRSDRLPHWQRPRRLRITASSIDEPDRGRVEGNALLASKKPIHQFPISKSRPKAELGAVGQSPSPGAAPFGIVARITGLPVWNAISQFVPSFSSGILMRLPKASRAIFHSIQIDI
jgi:hypothetical protein